MTGSSRPSRTSGSRTRGARSPDGLRPGVLLVALCLVLAVAPAARADVVAFGQRSLLEGEVKLLERGQLHFKTDATGTILVEWNDVLHFDSDQLLRVELRDGTLYFGSVRDGARTRTVRVLDRTGPRELDLDDIVRIQPIEESFRDRLDITVSTGYSFTRASDISQFNLGLRASYETERWESRLRVDAINTRDAQDEDAARNTLSLSSRRLRGRSWATGGALAAERNDGQGLDLRLSMFGQVERFLLRSNSRRAWVLAGIGVIREERAGVDQAQESLESAFGAHYELYRFDDPEIDIISELVVRPNLTDWGRLRSDANLTLRWNLWRDLNWDLSLYGSYDTSPDIGDAERGDYGIVTAVSYDL